MAIFLEKDPLTGVESYLADNDSEEKGIRIHYQQDIEPLLNYTKAIRNDGLADSGIKRDLWHYAMITPIVIMKLKNEYGVDIFNRNHYKRLFQLLNTEFKYLKTTDKRHAVNN